MNISAYEATKVVDSTAFLTSTDPFVAYNGNQIHYYDESPSDSDYLLISVTFLRVGGNWTTIGGYCELSNTATPDTMVPFGPGIIHVFIGAGEYDTWISTGNIAGDMVKIYDGTPIEN